MAAVADVVDAHGGNWENSSLAELAGTFAGVIEVSVPTEQAAELESALRGLQGQGLLTLAVLTGTRMPPQTTISCSRSRCSATTVPASCAKSPVC